MRTATTKQADSMLCCVIVFLDQLTKMSGFGQRLHISLTQSSGGGVCVCAHEGECAVPVVQKRLQMKNFSLVCIDCLININLELISQTNTLGL